MAGVCSWFPAHPHGGHRPASSVGRSAAAGARVGSALTPPLRHDDRRRRALLAMRRSRAPCNPCRRVGVGGRCPCQVARAAGAAAAVGRREPVRMVRRHRAACRLRKGVAGLRAPQEPHVQEVAEPRRCSAASGSRRESRAIGREVAHNGTRASQLLARRSASFRTAQVEDESGGAAWPRSFVLALRSVGWTA